MQGHTETKGSDTGNERRPIRRLASDRVGGRRNSLFPTRRCLQVERQSRCKPHPKADHGLGWKVSTGGQEVWLRGVATQWIHSG